MSDWVANADETLGVDLSITNLDVDSNTFDVNNNILVVTADVDITGTLDGTGAGNPNHSFGSLSIQIGGIYDATGGTTTITSENAGGRALDFTTGTLNANSGLIDITGAIITTISVGGAIGNIYDLQIDQGAGRTSWITDINIDNDLTITANSIFRSSGLSDTMTVVGDVLVNGTLNHTTVVQDGAMSYGSLVINVGGRVDTTSGTTTLTSENAANQTLRFNGGVFNHNNGLVLITYDALDVSIDGRCIFYDLQINLATPANNVRIDVTNLTIQNDLTVTSGGLNIFAATGRSMTITGDVLIENGGTLDGLTGVGPVIAGSLTINVGGEYSATSGTTTLTARAAAYVFENLGIFTHNNGITLITTTTGANSRFKSGGDSLFDLTIDTAAGYPIYIRTDDLTVDNNFAINVGNLDTWTAENNALTVAGTTTIGDGVGAVSSAQLICNSSDLDLDGDILINTDGDFDLPDTAGSFLFAGAITNYGVFTHNDGTATSNLSAGNKRLNDAGGVVELVFYNLILNGTNATRRLEIANDMTAENQITITMGIFRTRTQDRTVTITVGTVTASGTIDNNSSFDFGGGLNTPSILAASVDFPVICTGTNWDWDLGPDPIVANLDHRIDATTGGNGVTITWQGLNNTIQLFTISINDTVVLSDASLIRGNATWDMNEGFAGGGTLTIANTAILQFIVINGCIVTGYLRRGEGWCAPGCEVSGLVDLMGMRTPMAEPMGASM